MGEGSCDPDPYPASPIIQRNLSRPTLRDILRVRVWPAHATEKSKLKHPIRKLRNTSPLPPLQPESCSPFPRGYRVQSAQIASLEHRINEQQKRMNAQDAFIAVLKKEVHALKDAFRETVTALGASLKPSPLDRPARKGKLQ